MSKFQIAMLLLLAWSLFLQFLIFLLLLAVSVSVLCVTDVYVLCHLFP